MPLTGDSPLTYELGVTPHDGAETRIRFLLHQINNDTPNKEVSRS
jgi:hypothetical protein